MQNPLAEAAEFEYDASGNRVAAVAPLGGIAYYGYDALDRLAFLRADALGLDAVTYFSYDALGRRTLLTDAEFHSTYFAYDALRLLWESVYRPSRPWLVLIRSPRPTGSR